MAFQKITIEPVTRIEGHAKVTVYMNEDGSVNLSGLGATLARAHFTAEPLTAVPSAISSVCHSVIGSFLAGIWRNRLPDGGR